MLPATEALRQCRVEGAQLCLRFSRANRKLGKEGPQPTQLRFGVGSARLQLGGKGGGKMRGDEDPKCEALVGDRRLHLFEQKARERFLDYAGGGTLLHGLLTFPAPAGAAPPTPFPEPGERWRRIPSQTPRRTSSARPGARCRPPSAHSPSLPTSAPSAGRAGFHWPARRPRRRPPGSLALPPAGRFGRIASRAHTTSRCPRPAFPTLRIPSPGRPPAPRW